MTNALFMNNEFLKLLGIKIKTLRELKGLKQDYLAKVTKIDRTKLSKIENGKLVYVDIGYLQMIAQHLGLEATTLVAAVLDDLNTSFSAIKSIYQFINDCEFNKLAVYLKTDSIGNILLHDQKLSLYVQCAFLFNQNKYQEIITLLANIKNSDVILPSLLDVLIANYYYLAYIYINYENYKIIKDFSAFASKLEKSIRYYLDYYPHIMIRVLSSQIDYYRIAKEIKKANQLVNEVTSLCYKAKLFDTLVDVILNKLAIDIQYYNGKNIEELIKNINCHIKAINIPHKNKFIRQKVELLISINNKYKSGWLSAY